MEDPSLGETPRHFAHLRDKFVTIVCLGDSITANSSSTHGGHNWAGYLWMGLIYVFPKGYTIINSGIGGDHMVQGLARLDRDVLRFDPDIVIISYGMNDCHSTTPDIFKEQVRTAIHRIRENEPVSIILRTPNPMVNMWNGREQISTPSDDESFLGIAPFAKVLCELAEEENTQIVDHYTMWTESMKSECVGDFIFIMSDPVHPNANGHRRLYHELAPVFNARTRFFYEWERILIDQGQNL